MFQSVSDDSYYLAGKTASEKGLSKKFCKSETCLLALISGCGYVDYQ